MSKKIGYDFWHDVLKSPRYVAAPMVDMSELAFRELCRRYNSELCYTPMLHSQQFLQDVLYRSDCFSTSLTDTPLIVQFCANDPDVFFECAKIVSSKCDAVDLNLGCPQTIAKKGHYGAFLQDEWDLVHSIVRKAAADLPVPVTCKMRILPGDSKCSVDYAKMLEDAGCSVLTVHGRTRYQRGHDTGLASWDVIRDIKQNVDIPVIANGNILTFSDVQECLEYTGADAVMSAEGLLHNPALFTGNNPYVWDMGQEYLRLAEIYKTPIRIVRNHMYRLFYLCIHQDDKLRSSLENASSLNDFHHVCELIKMLPQVTLEHNKHIEDKNGSFYDDFEIGNLFSSFLNVCDTDDDAYHGQISSETAPNGTIEMPKSDDKTSPKYSEVLDDQFLPIWLCHSRPRIALSGNRGCYSKYFKESDKKPNKVISEEDESILSKRQQRKARHYFKVLAAMKENRKAKKLRRKQKLSELRQANYSEETIRSTARVPHKEIKLAIRQRLLDAQNHAPKICIDLGFSSQMANKELTRLSTQLRRLYGANRHSLKPVHLYFCNFCPSDPLYEICVSKNDGFSSYVVDMTEHSPETMFPTTDIIFLSPDSENVLHTLDENKVYVIGGIVDDSVKKGVSLTHAENLQVQTVRLPICEYLKRHGSGNTILTVNQVFEILLKFYETQDWVVALTSGVPKRKGFRAPQAIPSAELSEDSSHSLVEEDIKL